MSILRKNYFGDRVFPHLLSFIGFFIILAIYFYPAFFEDKTLLQNDVLQGLAAGREAVEFREATGEEALWTNSMFGGMPLYLINLKFSGEWITSAMNISKIFPQPADTVFLNFICFYILLAVFRVRPMIAFLGAFVYAFGTYNIISIEAGHIWKVRAISFMPLVFAGVVLLFRRKWFIGLGLTALAATLELASQHYQITYYLFLMLTIFMVNELIYHFRSRELPKYFKVVGVLLIAGLLAIGTSSGRLWMVNEYSKYSIRGKSELASNTQSTSGGLDRDYAFAWSQGIMETLTLLVPNLFGGASNVELGKNSQTYETLRQQGVPLNNINQFIESVPTYWGDQPFTSGPVYTGIIVIFLFVLGMFVLKPKEKYWALAAVILSLFLAWGKNFETFNYLMFDYFPAYNKFRAVSMAMTIALFCFPLIAALGLERLVQSAKNQIVYKHFLYALGVVGGLLLLIFIFSGAPDFAAQVDAQLPDWLIEAIRADRKSMLVKDTFRSLFFLVAAAVLIHLFVKNKAGQLTMLLGLAGLTVLDLMLVDWRYLNTDNFTKQTVQNYFEPSPLDQQILKDTALSYRVFNVQGAFSEARTSYFHKSIGGYHGAKLRRYQDLIEHQISKNNVEVLNMLNTKYVITGDPKNPLQKNPDALGNAWFVKTVVPVGSPDAEINALSNFDPSREAFIDTSRFKLNQYQYDTTGSIRLIDYQPNQLKYTAQTAGESFAVFSEIYYPEGWTANIDGKEAEIVRVNYVLRGLKIPPGNHEIIFTFRPSSYVIGNKVMWVSSALIALLFAVGLILAGKREYENVKEEKKSTRQEA